MYRNDNTIRNINQNFRKKQNKIIKIKRQNQINKLKTFCLTFFAFSLTFCGIFCFLFGQAKLNELTYKMNKNEENFKEEIVQQSVKNSTVNVEKSESYATEDKVIIYQ